MDMASNLPRKQCPDCQSVMTVTGADHLYGIPLVNMPEDLESSLQAHVEVVPYICENCGLVRLFAWKTIQRDSED